jgi:hypothetical protein
VTQLKPEGVNVRNLPETALDREADLRLRNARKKSIAAYAAEMAGSDLDLDADLEATGIEHLINTTGVARTNS